MRVAGPGGQDDRYHPFTLGQLNNFELALRAYGVQSGGVKQAVPWQSLTGKQNPR